MLQTPVTKRTGLRFTGSSKLHLGAGFDVKLRNGSACRVENLFDK